MSESRDDNPTEATNLVRIIELEKRMVLSNAMAQDALRLAANDLRARLDAMNEFRHQLDRQAATFVTTREMELRFHQVTEDKRASIALWISLLAIAVSVMLGLIRLIR